MVALPHHNRPGRSLGWPGMMSGAQQMTNRHVLVSTTHKYPTSGTFWALSLVHKPYPQDTSLDRGGELPSAPSTKPTPASRRRCHHRRCQRARRSRRLHQCRTKGGRRRREGTSRRRRRVDRQGGRRDENDANLVGKKRNSSARFRSPRSDRRGRRRSAARQPAPAPATARAALLQLLQKLIC